MNIKIVKPVGKLDVSASTEFRREVNAIVTANCPKFLVIDLELVTFMDSSGLGALVSALKAVRGGKILEKDHQIFKIKAHHLHLFLDKLDRLPAE